MLGLLLSSPWPCAYPRRADAVLCPAPPPYPFINTATHTLQPHARDAPFAACTHAQLGSLFPQAEVVCFEDGGCGALPDADDTLPGSANAPVLTSSGSSLDEKTKEQVSRAPGTGTSQWQHCIAWHLLQLALATACIRV